MGKISLKNSGFTMIEILVTSGIMALFSLTLIAVFLATVRGGIKAQRLQVLHQDGDFALESMARLIRQSRGVECGTDFTVTTEDGGSVVFSLVEDADNNVVKVASNSAEFLTGDLGEASLLSFTCYEGDVGNQVVSLGFTLTAGTGDSAQIQEKITQSFATSVATRVY